jgi:hypothetical protein
VELAQMGPEPIALAKHPAELVGRHGDGTNDNGIASLA